MQATGVTAAVKLKTPRPYIPKKLIYPNIHIPNRSLAFSLSFGKHPEEIEKIQKAIDEYNDWVFNVFSREGFLEFFIYHDCDITQETYCNYYARYPNGTKQNAIIFGDVKEYDFSTAYAFAGGHFFDLQVELMVSANLPSHSVLSFSVSESDQSYPMELDGKWLLWNWSDNYRDFTPYLFNYFSNTKSIDKRKLRKYMYLDVYDQSRYEDRKGFSIMLKCLDLLVESGFVQVFNLKPEREFGKWIYYAKQDHSIDVILLDPLFGSDKEITKKINGLL